MKTTANWKHLTPHGALRHKPRQVLDFQLDDAT